MGTQVNKACTQQEDYPRHLFPADLPEIIGNRRARGDRVIPEECSGATPIPEPGELAYRLQRRQPVRLATGLRLLLTREVDCGSLHGMPENAGLSGTHRRQPGTDVLVGTFVNIEFTTCRGRFLCTIEAQEFGGWSP